MSKLNVRPLFSTICQIFAGSVPDINRMSDFSAPEAGEQLLGSVTDEKAKLFWLFGEEIMDYVLKLAEEHEASDGPCSEDSIAFVKFQEIGFGLMKQRGILRSLFWEFVYRQFPYVYEPDVLFLHKGWQIAFAREPLHPKKPLFKEDHCSRKFLDDIGNVCKGASNINFKPVFKEINTGAGEKVIGTVEDKILRAVKAYHDRFVSQESDVPKFKNEEEFKTWMFSRTMLDLFQIRNRIGRIEKQSELLSNLFWAGVDELVPASRDYDSIGIRKDWKIVSLPEKQKNGSDHEGFDASATLKSHFN